MIRPKTSYIQGISTFFDLMTLFIPAGILAFLYHQHLKSSSPQVPAQDNEMIAGIFPGKVIIVAGGKLTAI